MSEPTLPRPYTAEEVRAQVQSHVQGLIRYWATVTPHNGDTIENRLEGLAFSILAMLDGASANLPGFTVTPAPHPTDEAYHRERGENWYDPAMGDIAGGLHEGFSKEAPSEVRPLTPKAR